MLPVIELPLLVSIQFKHRLLARFGFYFWSSCFFFQPKAGARERVNFGVRTSYIRVLGLTLNTEGPGRSGVFSGGKSLSSTYAINTEMEEEEIRKLASTKNIYELIARSIAPSIYGSMDIKKAIACLLFGGSRKR